MLTSRWLLPDSREPAVDFTFRRRFGADFKVIGGSRLAGRSLAPGLQPCSTPQFTRLPDSNGGCKTTRNDQESSFTLALGVCPLRGKGHWGRHRCYHECPPVIRAGSITWENALISTDNKSRGFRFPVMQGLLPIKGSQVPLEIVAGLTLAAGSGRQGHARPRGIRPTPSPGRSLTRCSRRSARGCAVAWTTTNFLRVKRNRIATSSWLNWRQASAWSSRVFR